MSQLPPNTILPFPGATSPMSQAPIGVASLADMANAKRGNGAPMGAPPPQQQPMHPGMQPPPQGMQPPLAQVPQLPQVPAPMMAPTPGQTPVPQTAVFIATAHSYAQRVPWFVWIGVGATAAYFYNKRGK